MTARKQHRWRPYAETATRKFYGAAQATWQRALGMVWAVKLRASWRRRDVICWGIERLKETDAKIRNQRTDIP